MRKKRKSCGTAIQGSLNDFDPAVTRSLDARPFMKTIIFYYDPISPYAYLAFEQLPVSLKGLSYAVQYKPILFAGLLKTFGQLGPAEIAPKRDWTYRQVLWQAKQLGVQLDMPTQHPFNPLPLLRLALACGSEQGCTNRHLTQQIFNHVWLGGASASDELRLAALTQALHGKTLEVGDATHVAVKTRLKANTDEALQAGCFGVPSMVVDGKVFWGLDALPMLRDHLRGDPWFDDPAQGWDSVRRVAAGIKRA